MQRTRHAVSARRTTARSSGEERFDLRCDGRWLIVVEHVTRACDRHQSRVGYVGETAAHALEAIVADFTFGVAFEPARYLRFAGDQPQRVTGAVGLRRTSRTISAADSPSNAR